MKQDIIIVEQLERSLGEAAARVKHDRLFCLTDETTLRLCWPKVQKMSAMQGAKVITIGAGDETRRSNRWRTCGPNSRKAAPHAIRCS